MNAKLTASQVAYELLMFGVIIGVFVAAQATSLWVLYGFGFLLFLGALMIVLRAGVDALFDEYLSELGPISWTVSFIPCLFAAFIGVLLDR